jgi:hypothetical protein
MIRAINSVEDCTMLPVCHGPWVCVLLAFMPPNNSQIFTRKTIVQNTVCDSRITGGTRSTSLRYNVIPNSIFKHIYTALHPKSVRMLGSIPNFSFCTVDRLLMLCLTLLSAVAQLVEALRYKPEDRGFDSQWCQRNVSLTWFFRSHYGPGVDSACNRNECQEYFLGRKGGQGVGLTILLPSCADCLPIREPQPPATLRTCPCSTGTALHFLR